MQTIATGKRLQLFFDNAVEHALIITDQQGRIAEWSAGAERLLGWSMHEAIGQQIAMIYTPQDRDNKAPQAEMHTALALGRSDDVRWHQHKDGSTIFCDGAISAIIDEASRALLGFGKIMRQASATSDDHVDAQGNATGEQRSFLAAVLESVESGIVACDQQGKLTFFNDAAREIHGLDEAPLSFEQWAETYNLYTPDGASLLPLNEVPLYRALMGERVENARILVKQAGGKHHHVEVTGRPLKDGRGNILGAVISMHDVTALHEIKMAHAETVTEHGKRVLAEESERRLRKAETQLRVATEAAQLGIWTWDVAHDTGTWENDRMHEIFALPSRSNPRTGATFMADYLHPDDVARFRQAVSGTTDDAARFHFIGRYYRLPDQAVRWIELAGTLQSASDAPVIIGTAADITLRQELEKTVEDARLRLAATLSAGEIATWIWNMRTDQLIGDRNLTRLFNLPEDMMTGAPLAAYIDNLHPDDVDEVKRQIKLTVETHDAYRAVYRIVDAQGRDRWVSARGRIETDDQGRAIMLAGVILDITPQKLAEAELRAAEERYRTLITSMDEAFAIIHIIVDDHGTPVDYRFEEVNRAFEQQSGLADAAGKTIREMVPDIEAHWIDVYGQVALTRAPQRFTQHSLAMGYWWDVYATPMGEPGERRIAILFTDITERTKSESKLRELAAHLSESNRHKTEFLATLAHELRNPLAPMRTGLDLIRMPGRAGANSGKVLEMMDRQLNQIVHLIDDLMDIARISSGKIALKKERVDLKVAVADAVEASLQAIEAARHELQVNLPADAVFLDVDRTRLAQILANLLTNAAKYTANGGKITLSVARNAGKVVIAVADTGIGIPVEEQAHVFDMFSQVSRNMGRAQGGLGIGLSLVRSLVEMHDGTIEVASPGIEQGTVFTVSFPAASDAPVDSLQQAAATDEGPDTGRLRVLIADDNADAARLLCDLFEALGHTTVAVHNGIEAFEKIVETRPDMAILDIGMPGLNGYEVARKIKRRQDAGNILLVALTGWGGALDRYQSESAGFDAHVTKPAGLGELKGIIDQAAKKLIGKR
jgi:PAS domain S-box-containing protein